MTERKKILIIRLSSIGDIILTTPVIRALALQSDFEIHALTKQQNKQFYENNPHINKVYSFKNSLKEIIPSLKKEKYFHVIDLHKNFRSYIVRFNLKVKSTTFPKLTLEKFLLTRFKKNNLPNIHIVERYFKADILSLTACVNLEKIKKYNVRLTVMPLNLMRVKLASPARAIVIED